MTKQIIQGLKRQTAEVVADKRFSKVMDAYVEEDKRELFSVTLFNGKPNFFASPRVAKLLEESPSVLETLTEIFEKKLELDENKVEERVMHKIGEPELPMLFAPFKDKARGWTKETVSEQLTLYLNILGYGYGGDKSLTKTKNKESTKPSWFPPSVDFDGYSHPSHAKLSENEDILESLMKHHGLDPLTHARKGEIIEKEKRRSLNASVLADPVVLGGGLNIPDDDPDNIDFETFAAAVQKSTQPKDLKRRSRETGESSGKKSNLSKQAKKLSDKSEYEKIRDRTIAERKEEEKRLNLLDFKAK